MKNLGKKLVILLFVFAFLAASCQSQAAPAPELPLVTMSPSS
jgi:hypothetical protein